MSIARNKRGFTIIEAIVSIALTAVTIVGALGAIRAMTRSETIRMDTEYERRLAVEKYQEIVAIQDFTTASGDFNDRNDSRYVWEMSTTPTSITNLVTLTIKVHPTDSQEPKDEYTVSGLIYQAPQTSTTGTPTSAGGGG